MRFVLTGLVLALALPLSAQSGPTVGDLLARVQASRLSRTVNRLVAFGTRHTLSDAVSDNHGIGATRRWLRGEFQSLTQLPGSRLVPFQDTFTAGPGPLLPKAVDQVNIGAWLPAADPNRAKQALVVTAHYDSRGTDPMNAGAAAPGAVDNGSGVAVVLEMATVLAAEHPAVNVYFVATAAGVQGQLGAARLAQRLKDDGVEVLGMVAVDRVGNTQGSDGSKDTNTVRLFSESGVPAVESEGQRRLRGLLGTENDSPDRELARYLRRAGEHFVDDLDCAVMLRRERIARESEAQVFAGFGWPAVLVTEMIDNYDHLDQDLRSTSGKAYGDSAAYFDPGYCARITRMLVAGLRQLALAPEPPQNVGLGGLGGPDAKLWWTLPDDPRIKGIVVLRRRADALLWQQDRIFNPEESQVLQGASPDSYVFAVATADADGDTSLPVIPRSVQY